VTTDDLSAPLGQNKAPKRRLLPLAVPRIAVGVLSTFVVVLLGWMMIVNDPFGGEPIAIVSADPKPTASAPNNPGQIAIVRPGGPAGGEHPTHTAEPAQPAAPAGKTITIIDGTSGKREQIVIPERAEQKSAAIEEKLTEPSRHGPLPKIAADGARVADVYARPVVPIDGKPDAPRIAIVVGGLGIGTAGTNAALDKLPGPVTLAFAPYSDNLDRLTARARGNGHEVLLQVPMEPLDYPDNDPGPQTLLTSLDARQNVDRLQWLMSRMQGYVGIANYMGARFTTSEAALTPVMREASKRGLLFLDDGSSQRSLTGQIAGAANLPFAKADLTIDAVPTANDVDRALARLESIARERGVAVGMASALPVSVERIARWAKAAESRDLLLIPISAAAKQPAESRRQTTENRR
jgi:hypothetical protein